MSALHSDSAGWLLAVLPGLPLLTAVVLLAGRSLSDRGAVRLGAIAAGLTLVLAGVLSWAAAPFDQPGPGLVVNWPWIGQLGVRLHLALDGISVPLVLLTALLGLLVVLHSAKYTPVPGRARGLVACFLAVEAGSLATFLAWDLLLFFISFEFVLVPMWFAIAFYGDASQPERRSGRGAPIAGGQRARRQAANRFLLFTLVGSALMLLGLLIVAVQAGTTDLGALSSGATAQMSDSSQLLAAALIVTGLAVKAPIFPLHTWLPPAHTIAPTGGSVLLAAVLLKLGTYGLVRVAVPVLPRGMHQLAPTLAVLAVAGIVWGGFACLAETDLKRLIAFSSVAHMGFVLLGVASLNPVGLQGALFANVAHGLITGLLFLVVGSLKDRYHSADLAVLGSGLRDRLPKLGWLLAFGALAGLGLPGLAGFWGEILAIAGCWQAGSQLGGLAHPLAAIAIGGTILAAAYLLRVLYLVWHGPRADLAADEAAPGEGAVSDGGWLELLLASPLVAGTFLIGLLPWLLLDLTGPAVRLLIGVSSSGVRP